MKEDQTDKKNLKSLLCQISPFHKDSSKTRARVAKSFELYNESHKLDLIVFPEMSFIGYNFKDKEDALPYSHKQGEGDEFEFVRKIAIRLKSYVAFGYIEKDGDNLYNSASVLDRNGNLIVNYRKTHLYFNDKLWSQEGSGFTTFTLLTH